MMLLWVNLHGGYVIGLGLIGLYIISLLLDRKWHLVPRLGLVLLVAASVVPLNPNGFRMFVYPFETLGLAATSFIDEWASPDFHKIMFLPFALLLFVLLGALAWSTRRPRASELFLLLITGLGALRAARHIPIFALIAAPIFAKYLWDIVVTRGWEKRFSGAEAPATSFALVFNLVFLLAPATLGVVRVTDFVKNQRAYEAKNYPQAAVNFLLAKQLPGPIYNRYGWGGYLIRRLYPNYRVYIDGRADVYGDSFTLEAVRTYDGHPEWRKPLERLGVRTVIISPNAALSSLLREDHQWTKVFEDKQAVIFTRPGSDVANKAVDPSSPNALTVRQ
jgi:hypothetical protein